MLSLDPALHAILRSVLSLLMIWAAAHKLRDVASFRAAVAGYGLLPQRVVAPAAGLLVAAESGIAVALWIPALATVAALGAAGLLAVYTGAIAVTLARGRAVDCGCLGAAGARPVSGSLILRNMALIVAALLLALPAGERPLTWVDGVTTTAGVVALAVLYGALDRLLAQAAAFAPLPYTPGSPHA